MSETEYCIQYTLNDGTWTGWPNTTTSLFWYAEHQLQEHREAEWEPSVKYRIAKREVTEWEGME